MERFQTGPAALLEINLLTVTLLALGTALATGLGALPFAFVRSVDGVRLGTANALAAGLMLAASLMLVVEGWAHSVGGTLGGVIAGAAFVWASGRWLDGRDDLDVGALRGADARKALLIMGVMTVHSLAEGVGVGVSYGGGEALGLFITAAIALHNVPEGLAIALVLVPRGVSVWAAAGWAVVSSLPQPLLAPPSFLAVEAFEPILAPGLGFAAGAMVAMTASELIPEALEEAPASRVATVAGLAVLGGFALQLVLVG